MIDDRSIIINNDSLTMNLSVTTKKLIMDGDSDDDIYIKMATMMMAMVKKKEKEEER